MKKYQLLLLSVLSGLLFALSWPLKGFPGLLFVALIPMLFIEDYLISNKDRFHKFSIITYLFPGFFVWNILTTYWIWNSTVIGGIGAVFLNSTFMTIIMTVYHLVRRNIYARHSHYILIFLWIAWEYFHQNWDLTWPWLNIGNGFASFHKWIQWYEFTGASGGTLWVILVNILLYHCLQSVFNRKGKRNRAIIPGTTAIILIAVPLIISFIIYSGYREKKDPVEIVVVQPNLDPYTEQYELPPLQVLNGNLQLALKEIDVSTKFVVCPESALQENIWEKHPISSVSIDQLKYFVRAHPYLTFIIGASTFKEYGKGELLSPTVRKFRDYDGYYDAYNTVFLIDTTGIDQWRHKSKLTPGVERMPFPKYLKFLENFAIDLGGTIGSLGIDKEQKVFTTIYDSLKVAALICYESVYSDYVSRFVRNGANLIFVVTNDGWWGNTPGHRQHYIYSKIRAIENRRSIARSANTGISAFVNQRGDVLESSPYWVPAVMKHDLNANRELTFFVRKGDYISRVSSFIAVLFILISISLSLSRKSRKLHMIV